MLRTFARGFKFVANYSLVKPLRFYSTGGEGALNRKLEDKVALITGGASGLGKATACEFIRHGAKVIIADIDAQSGPQVAKELGPEAEFIPCDVTIEDQVAEAVEATVSRHGKLNIMYNNAGVAGPLVPPSFADIDLSEFDRVMQINLRGMVAGIKHAARAMIPAKSGSILCTCSIAGVMGGLTPHVYSISKSAIPGLVRSAASELCQHGVRINCISPTGIPTPFALNEFAKMCPDMSEQQIAEFVFGLGKLKGAKCEDVDIARAALYLASDDAKFVTGHNLVVDGGFTCFKDGGIPLPTQA